MTKNSFHCNLILLSLSISCCCVCVCLSLTFVSLLLTLEMYTCMRCIVVCESVRVSGKQFAGTHSLLSCCRQSKMQIASTNPSSGFVRFAFQSPMDEYFRNSFIFSAFQHLSRFSSLQRFFFDDSCFCFFAICIFILSSTIHLPFCAVFIQLFSILFHFASFSYTNAYFA